MTIKNTLFILMLAVFSFSVSAQDIPEDHPFADITKGMEASDVQSLLGKPTRKTNYQTGKGKIPGAGRWLNDTRRQSWFYKGKGSIVLSKNKYSGLYLVREVNYDPKQK